MTPKDGRTAPLTSKCCNLYIYSTHIGTEYFKHGIYSPFFPLQDAAYFINLAYLVPVLFTFYIQGMIKLKSNSGAKRLIKLPCCIKLAFHFISWGRCAVKQPSSLIIILCSSCRTILNLTITKQSYEVLKFL